MSQKRAVILTIVVVATAAAVTGLLYYLGIKRIQRMRRTTISPSIFIQEAPNDTPKPPLPHIN